MHKNTTQAPTKTYRASLADKDFPHGIIHRNRHRLVIKNHQILALVVFGVSCTRTPSTKKAHKHLQSNRVSSVGRNRGRARGQEGRKAGGQQENAGATRCSFAGRSTSPLQRELVMRSGEAAAEEAAHNVLQKYSHLLH